MIELDKNQMRKRLRRQRDAMLREAILASIRKKGEPDEYFIINYLIEKLLPGEAIRSFLEYPPENGTGVVKSNIRKRVRIESSTPLS